MKLVAVSCLAVTALALAACGQGEPPSRDAPSPASAQATVTPEPTPEKPKLRGHPLRGATTNLRDDVARALRRQAGKVFASGSKITWSGCDRIHEGTLTMACFLTAADGSQEVVIVWGDPVTRDAVGYKVYSRLTCAEREQGLAGRQAEALARLTHPQTRYFPQRPSKAKIRREMRREMDRRCASGSSRTVPGNEAVEAVVGPTVKIRRK